MMEVRVLYLGIAGYAVRIDDCLLVFSLSIHENEHASRLLLDEVIRAKEVYFFVPDATAIHYTHELAPYFSSPHCFFIANENTRSLLPSGERVHFVKASQTLQVGELSLQSVSGGDSCLGFVVQYHDFRVYHAGDLSLGADTSWMDIDLVEQMEHGFYQTVAHLPDGPLDLCMVTTNPSQGKHYDAAANYIILEKKPTVFLPMQFFEHEELIIKYCQEPFSAKTRMVPLTEIGQFIQYTVQSREKITFATTNGQAILKGNPFHGADLPVFLQETQDTLPSG